MNLAMAITLSYCFFKIFIEQHWHFTNRFLVVSRHLLWSDSWEWGRGRKRLQFRNGALRGLKQHSACICLNLQKSCCRHKTGPAWSESYYGNKRGSHPLGFDSYTSLEANGLCKKSICFNLLGEVAGCFHTEGKNARWRESSNLNHLSVTELHWLLNWLIRKYHLLKAPFFFLCVWIYIMNCNMHYVLRKHYTAEENPHNTLLKDFALGGMTWQR